MLQSRKVSMKNVVAIFTLLFLCSAISNGQNSNFRPIIKEELLALNFANKILFIPSGLEKKNTDELSATDAIEKVSSIQFKYAMMLDVDVESLSNLSLLSFIEKWYGTPYRLGGTTKKGIDCSAFSGNLLSSVFSFSLPRTAREQYKICERIKKEDLMAGDLVFFNTEGRGVSHVGVYLANGRFVHSCTSQGVMISSLDDSYFSRKFVGGGRVNQ